VLNDSQTLARLERLEASLLPLLEEVRSLKDALGETEPTPEQELALNIEEVARIVAKARGYISQ